MATLFDAHWVIVCPVHQAAEFIPLVHAAKLHPIAHAQRHTPGQVDVVRNQQALPIRQSQNKSLMS